MLLLAKHVEVLPTSQYLHAYSLSAVRVQYDSG
jgi:hypothetical protein